MPALLTCPGIDRAHQHNGGCCAAFAALTPAQRASRGIVQDREPTPAEERPVPPPPPVTTIAELAELIAERQRLEAEAGGRTDHPEQIIWVEIGTTDRGQAFALIEMSRAYGCIPGWR